MAERFIFSAIKEIGTTTLLMIARTRSPSLLLLEYSRAGQLEIASIVVVIIAAISIVGSFLARRLGLTIAVE